MILHSGLSEATVQVPASASRVIGVADAGGADGAAGSVAAGAAPGKTGAFGSTAATWVPGAI
jgi:hypothetical protein